MKNTFMLIILATLLFVISGCGDTPETPKELKVTSTNPITLSWSAVSGAKTYSVYRGTTSGGTNSKTRIASGLTATTYSDTTAQGGTTYYYQVTAVNDDGGSSGSNEVQATAPGGSFALLANVVAAHVVLTWDSVADASSYTVYRGTTTTNLAAIQNNVAATTFTDTTVAAGATYYYQVGANNAAGTQIRTSAITNGIMP